jgi:hypothetical protein
LPTPTRAAIETNADAEWHRREGEAAMTKPIEASERSPIEAWCNWWPECEAAGPDEPTGAAEASTNRRTAEASTYRRTTEASTYSRTTEASTDHRATDASAHPAMKASTKAVTATHTSTTHSSAVSSTAVSSTATSTAAGRCNSRRKSDRRTDCGRGGNGNKRFSRHGTVSS